MHISPTVDRQPLIVGQSHRPQLAVAVKCPIIAVEPTPQYRSAVFVNELLAEDTFIICPDINNTYCIIAFAVYLNGVSADSIQWCFLTIYSNIVAVLDDYPLGREVDLISAVVLAVAPVRQECVTVKEGVSSTAISSSCSASPSEVWSRSP